MNPFTRVICNLGSVLLFGASVFYAPPAYSQQLVTGTAEEEIALGKKPKPDEIFAARRQLAEMLKQKVLSNTLQIGYAVDLKGTDSPKLEQLAEMLTDSITITILPPSGNVIQGKATLNVSSAKLQQYLANLKIGTTDVTKNSVRVVLSIDEYVGVATNISLGNPEEMTLNYSRDNSTFSDTSSTASSSASGKSASARSNQNNVARASSDRMAAAGRQSSAVSGQESGAIAGRGSSSGAVAIRDGYGGRLAASGASQSSLAGSSNSRMSAASSSQYARSASSSRALVDKSRSASSNSSSFAQSSSESQNNVQQVNDVENLTVHIKMPSFNNAKLTEQRGMQNALDGVLRANGLETVPERDLRSEGGIRVPVSEILNDGRFEDFKAKFTQKNIVADVWAMGAVNYTITGINSMGKTACSGAITVNAGFLDASSTLFSDTLAATAFGERDQECQANLTTALAKQLGDEIGSRALLELNERQSRGRNMIIELFSAEGDVGRQVRRQFQEALYKAVGPEGAIDRGAGKWEIQIKGKADSLLYGILDEIGWDKADFKIRGERICVGVEGPGVCPPEFRS